MIMRDTVALYTLLILEISQIVKFCDLSFITFARVFSLVLVVSK